MTKVTDKQKNYHDNKKVIRTSIEVEYIYLDQIKKQIDIKNIAK
jgi:hypothetical protein